MLRCVGSARPLKFADFGIQRLCVGGYICTNNDATMFSVTDERMEMLVLPLWPALANDKWTSSTEAELTLLTKRECSNPPAVISTMKPKGMCVYLDTLSPDGSSIGTTQKPFMCVLRSRRQSPFIYHLPHTSDRYRPEKAYEEGFPRRCAANFSFEDICMSLREEALKTRCQEREIGG